MKLFALHAWPLDNPLMQHRILHLDMDAFFASVETLDHPELLGQPVLVGGLGLRGVVAACSYEARRFGIHSAMPMARARRLCPGAHVMRPRMERYREISRLIFNYLERTAPVVERISVDEGYLDIGDLVDSNEEALTLGARLKKHVRTEFGLPCSIGIAPCKFISKIASDLRKPDALVLVRENDAFDFLTDLEVTRIPGVGPAAERKLRAVGVQTIGELRSLTREALDAMFGKWGSRLHDLARAIDPRPVVAEHERKSYGTETTFETDLIDSVRLRETIRAQSARIETRLKRDRQCARTVTLKVRYADFETVTRQRSFERMLSSAGEIAAVAEELMKQTGAGRRPVRLIGVTVSSLLDEGESNQGELPLFE